MSKIVYFEIDHCCFCPDRQPRLRQGLELKKGAAVFKEDLEYWCEIENREVTEIKGFPDWCPKPDREEKGFTYRNIENFLKDRL